MDRGPERAPIIAACALLCWLTLLVRLRSVRHGAAPAPKSRLGATMQRIVRFSTLVATQSMIQLSLFFALPFYVAATTLDVGHLAFTGLLSAMAAVSLWDPWTERLLARPVLGLLFPALASFAALASVSPGLGLSNRQALWLAAGLAGGAILLTGFGGRGRDDAEAPLGRLALAAALLPAFLGVGGARLIPAAPMRLMRIEFGTTVTERWVTAPVLRLSAPPESLFCATSIFAPLGVHEKLLHVWTRDGSVKHRIELPIRGGRAAGFRTRSRVGRPQGHSSWTCRVETESGQLLGAASIVID
jgi:hypothetical protein